MTSTAPQPTNYGQARAALANRTVSAVQGVALFVAAIVATAIIEGIL